MTCRKCPWNLGKFKFSEIFQFQVGNYPRKKRDSAQIALGFSNSENVLISGVTTFGELRVEKLISIHITSLTHQSADHCMQQFESTQGTATLACSHSSGCKKQHQSIGNGSKIRLGTEVSFSSLPTDTAASRAKK